MQTRVTREEKDSESVVISRKDPDKYMAGFNN
jgi:hypothetical protein